MPRFMRHSMSRARSVSPTGEPNMLGKTISTTSNAGFDGNTIEKRPSEITDLKEDNDLKKAETVVVVMGPTGVGKSRFIREATGLDVAVGDSLYSTTSKVQAFHFLHRHKSCALVDTPGFDDTVKSDAQVFQELAAWLAARYQEKTRLTAILYIQRISDTRVSGSILRNLMVMKRMLGVQSFPSLMLVTSMWDTIDEDIARLREQQLQEDFWSDLITSGAKTGRFKGDQRSALKILDMIADSGKISLTIQKELVDERIPLPRTSAGIFLGSEIQREKFEKPAEGYGPDVLSRIGTQDELNATWDPGYGSLWIEPSSDARHTWDPTLYQSLKTDQFRLVRISAGFGPSPIEMSILVENFQSFPKYAALSYVVGQPQQSRTVNFRRGATILEREIAENLHTALLQLRRAYVDVVLWIDQLSINQEDQNERSQQVRIMSKIFSHADNVCIWLGPGDLKTDAAFDLATRILDLEELELALQNPDLKQDFEQLTILMASPWFSRRWCVQELLLARSASVHCGTKTIRWSDFADVASLLSNRWLYLQNYLGLHRITNAALVPAMALIELSKDIVRRSSDGEILEYLVTLEYLLWRLAPFKVTDMHDVIYAIYDLVGDVTNKRVEVDYSMSIVDLFRDVTEMIVRPSGNLDIICRPWAPLSGLPSWIPTVSKSAYDQVPGGYHFERHNGDSFVGAPMSRNYKACGDFTARGTTNFRTEGVQHVLSAQGIKVGTVKAVAGECINGNIPHRWPELAGWSKIHHEEAPNAFWRTLVADRDARGTKAPEWFRRACNTAFRKSQTPNLEIKRLCATTQSENVKEFLFRVQSVVWSRSLAMLNLATTNILGISRKARSLCLCPPETCEGDIIAILYGCSVPVVLRSLPPYHRLIGECFVLGMMNGEFVKEHSLSTKKTVYDLI